MPWYRAMMRGENFFLELDGKVERHGFYTTRFVEAPTVEEAETQVIARIRNDIELRQAISTSPNSPPEFFLEEITEVEPDDVPESRGDGFSFYPAETDAQPPDNLLLRSFRPAQRRARTNSALVTDACAAALLRRASYSAAQRGRQRAPGAVTPDRIFDSVIAAAPGFRAVMDEHVRDNDEVLVHVLISDLLRYIGSHFTGSSSVPAPPPTSVEVKKVLAILDAAIVNGDAEAENAIAVSFIEGIESEPFFDRIGPLLGPNLRAELERQKAWRPSAR